MAKKFKDYYDQEYAINLSQKISVVYPAFSTEKFLALLTDLETLGFNDRQELLARALKDSLPMSYEETIQLFTQILGPELPGSLGMFSEGYWLWPLGKYVELFGAPYFSTSTAFCKELTKRFTGEYAMRPLIVAHPEQSFELLLAWSQDDNQRVRRLASECLRIRLPWAKKMTIVLDYFPEYKQILTQLKDDSDRTTQKSVANNLNDLYKDAPERFNEIILDWEKLEKTPATEWIIKHGSRTKNKQQPQTK